MEAEEIKGGEDEDVLEMVNAGLISFTVVDSWKAHLWAQVLPKIKVRKDLVLRNDGRVGWARQERAIAHLDVDG